jgi:GTP-binding protein Era
MKSGIVAIVGRPNVGKSTLLNALLGEKVAIVTPIPQTTRHQIRGILNEARGQAIFIDTPGMHETRRAFDRALISAIHDAVAGADVIIHLVDVTERVGEEEAMVFASLLDAKAPIILGLNKVDRGSFHLQDYLAAWEKRCGRPLSEVTGRVMPVPVSALRNKNLDKLLDEIFARLPEGPALYPENVLTDFPRQLTIQEIIREKLLRVLKDELPFSVAVHAEEITDRSARLTYVKAAILVERDTQKAIVIGHRGAVLKKVGEEARKELSVLYSRRFFLELWVKVVPRWKEDVPLLREIGYIS